MSGITTQLRDGRGDKHFAHVTHDNELLTIQSPYPPLEPQKTEPFRQYLTDDGTKAGSNDMGIDGSVTNVDFWVPANGTSDRYITSLSILVGYGTTGRPYEWADGTALTNGMRLFYTSERGEIDIHEAITRNQDVFRLSFGNITADWELAQVNQANDFGYIVSVNMENMGLIHGIKLDAGTRQKLVLRVRDNAGTDADSFNIIAYGFDRFA